MRALRAPFTRPVPRITRALCMQCKGPHCICVQVHVSDGHFVEESPKRRKEFPASMQESCRARSQLVSVGPTKPARRPQQVQLRLELRARSLANTCCRRGAPGAQPRDYQHLANNRQPACLFKLAPRHSRRPFAKAISPMRRAGKMASVMDPRASRSDFLRLLVKRARSA